MGTRTLLDMLLRQEVRNLSAAINAIRKKRVRGSSFYCPYQDASPEWAEVDLFLKQLGSSWVLTSYERIY